jgi:hypothetical protein
MQVNTARWIQIVLMDADDVAGLHARERSWATRLPDCGNIPRFQVDGRPSWRDLNGLAEAMKRLNPDGFWPAGMDESSRAQSAAAFEGGIWKMCDDIEKADFAAEGCPHKDECSCTESDKARHRAAANPPILLECLTMHRQDVAVRKSGIMPYRQSTNQERGQELIRKASKASGRTVYIP